MEPMTVLSKGMFEWTMQINTIEEALATLHRYEHFRTLGDVLRSFSSDPDIKKTLVSGINVWFPEHNPDSIDRKVRNWISGKTLSISKQDSYVISRILGLTLEQTNTFLKYAAGEGIHWRNAQDIVWCYSILHQLSPNDTWKLLEQANSAVSLHQKKKETSDSYTAEVYEKLQPILYQDEAALLAFLTDEQNRLGILHNTAYQQFSRYMDLLKRGYSEDGIEALFKEMTREEKKKATIPVDGDIGLHKAEPMTVRDILETYLYRNLIPIQARGQEKTSNTFSAIQRSIRQSWPDEASLSKMESRKLDVSRKALILLFLATDGNDSNFSDEYDDYESAEEIFLSIHMRLNTMLSACGFPQLDPRNPFDWMILFCISSGDLWESDDRLQAILTSMFSK